MYLFFSIFAPLLIFLFPAVLVASSLDTVAAGVLNYAITQYPIVALVLMGLGGAFVVLELLFKATATTKDDEKWKAIKSGYLAPFIVFCINYFKKKVTGKK
jgi:hypothetical protein